MFVGGISETRTKKPKTCAEGRLLSASLAYSGCIVLVKSHFPGVTAQQSPECPTAVPAGVELG